MTAYVATTKNSKTDSTADRSHRKVEICWRINVGTTVTRPCPRNRGETMDPIERRKTSVLPATIEVATCGIVIRQNATIG